MDITIVTCDPDTVDPDAIKKAIEDLGLFVYEVKVVQRAGC